MNHHFRIAQKGLTLVELMVAMAIGLAIVAATTFIYLRSNEGQKAMDRQSSVSETGAYVMQALGRDLKMAGFYPANVPPIATGTPVSGSTATKNSFMAATQQYMYETYPPLPSTPQLVTDWAAPATAYNAAIFGCDGGNFDSKTGACPTEDSNLPDSLVINWFASDASGTGQNVGNRKDCTGSDIVNDDASNAQRKINAITGSYSADLPPKLPLFGSNRYGLINANTYIDDKKLTLYSFACSGNGSSPHGVNGVYQGSVLGLADMQIEYGVYADDTTLAPAKFYKASDVSSMAAATIRGQSYTGWQRVTAVKICLISRSIGNQARISTTAATAPKYLDCDGVSQSMPAGQWLKRDIQIFGVRNNLRQSY